MAYPEWVEKQRRPGTSIHCIRGKYYLYEVKSKWNRRKGRSQPKAGKYLGRISEDELIPPKDKKSPVAESIVTREYGASSVLYNIGSDITASNSFLKYLCGGAVSFIDWAEESSHQYAHGLYTFRFFCALLKTLGFNVEVVGIVKIFR